MTITAWNIGPGTEDSEKMQTTVVVHVDIECPHCGARNSVGVDALIGTGVVPQEVWACYLCDREFVVEATLDVSVRTVTLGAPDPHGGRQKHGD